MSSHPDNWNSKKYNEDAAFVSQYGEDVVTLLAPVNGEKILDLGCGEGTLALKLKESGVDVVGIDASADMVKAAQAKGINAHVADAARLGYANEFDAVFSNATLHWVKPPESAAEGIYNALKPGGRFVAELGGKGNIQIIKSALIEAINKRGKDGKALDPWYFPSAEEYRALLEKKGFLVEKCDLFSRKTPLAAGVEGWLKIFAHTFLAPFSSQEAEAIIREVVAATESILKDKNGEWFADYVRLRVKALKS